MPRRLPDFRAPSQDLVKSRSHEIGTLNCRIALKFDRHIGSTAAEVPVKFQSDRTILNANLAASRLYEILRKDVFSDIETGPRAFDKLLTQSSPPRCGLTIKRLASTETASCGDRMLETPFGTLSGRIECGTWKWASGQLIAMNYYRITNGFRRITYSAMMLSDQYSTSK